MGSAEASESTTRGASAVQIEESDHSQVARGSALTLTGSVYAAAMGFVLTLVVGRLFGSETSGYFFEAVALFMILLGVSMFGSDTGMVRSVARYRALADPVRVRDAFVVTLVPVLAWSSLIAGILVAVSGWLAQHLASHDTNQVHAYIVVLALSLVPAALGQTALCATRSFGTLRPFVGLYQLYLPTTRVLGVVLLSVTGVPVRWLMLCYAVPLVVMDLIALGYCWRRVHDELPGRVPCRRDRLRRAAREEWTFNSARGLAVTFDTALVWIDVLIVGLLLGPGPAGAYAVASRFMTSGTMAAEALRLGTAPMIAAAFARNEPHRVQGIYGLSAIWLVMLSWPFFLAFATFAPFVLSLLGHDFVQAAPAMTVMSLGILVYLTMGNINSVLLMAGRSLTAMFISATTLTTNVVLNLLLVPHFELIGAAVAWAAALTVDSVLCLRWAHRHLEIDLPFRGSLLAAAVALVAWGVPGLVVRVWGEQSLPWLVAYAVAGLALYLPLLRRFRAPLGVEGLTSMVRGRVNR